MTDPGRGRGRGPGVAFLLLGMLVVVMDQTITAVVLPDIVRDLGVGVDEASLTITVFTVVAAVAFVPMGRLADAWGRRRTCASALVVFAAGSLLTGLATGMPTLLAGRAIQGLVLATIAPATVGMLNSMFPAGRERTVVFSLWATVSGSGVAIGPFLGGLLADAASWRVAFFVNIPLCLAAAAGVTRLLPESRGARGGIDWPGAALAGLGIGGVVFGLQEGPGRGWTTPAIAVMLLLGVAALAAFGPVEARRTRRGAPVLVDARLAGVRSFRTAVAASALMSMALYGVLLTLPIVVQFVLGGSALEAGLTLMALGTGMLIGGLGASPVIDRLGRRRVATWGLAAQPILLAATIPLLGATGSPWPLVPVLVPYGAAYGASFSALTNLTFADVPADLASLSGGVASTLRLAAGAMATALMVGLLVTVSSGGGDGLLDRYDLDPAQRQVVEQALHFSTGPGADSSGRRQDTLAALRDDPATAPLVTAVDDRLLSGARWALALAAALALAGAALTRRLPRADAVPRPQEAPA